jgi:hypothetical protein
MEYVNVFPGDKVIPRPTEGFCLMFLSFLLCGLSLPAHEFLRGLPFVYGVQLHQLTPNSILHVAFFITICEVFLGIDPHWVLWKQIFYLRHNASKEEIHDMGGAIICVRSDAQYFSPLQIQFGIGGPNGSMLRTRNLPKSSDMGWHRLTQR